jgi:xanthine dehydrogenase accessory factor
MKEIRAILRAEESLRTEGVPMTLATVLQVEGSSYRRPGARMLISATGEIVGSLSGGCLERDLIRRSQANLVKSGFEIIRYDTTEDGEEFETMASVGLGCQGIVDIGLETLVSGHAVLDLFKRSIRHRTTGSVATVISHQDSSREKNELLGAGSCWILEGDHAHGSVEDPDFQKLLRPALEELRHNEVRDITWSRGVTRVLLEAVKPPLSWLIFGAGHDAVPMAELAQSLGWEVTVMDCHSAFTMPSRFFSEVDHYVQGSPENIAEKVRLDSDSFCVVMTHNYFHDREIVKQLLQSKARYIGLLGPKKKSTALLEDLKTKGGVIEHASAKRLFSPAGIDLGADSPQEIALSVIAEACSVAALRSGGFLRDRSGPIHDREISQ